MKRALTAIAIVAVVTACSSGGGGRSAPAVVPAPASTATVAPQAVGSAKLTIKFPATFGHAKAPSGSKRSPKYVNPGNYYLDVYVDQKLVLIGGSGLSYDTAAITNSNGDGTQTLTIPLYSSGTNDVVVAERDQNTDPSVQPGNLLALGQATDAGPDQGNQNFVSVQMAMNIFAFAYSFDDSTATSITTYGQYIETPGASIGPSGNGFWLLPVDATYGYTTGASGTGLPTITTTPYPPYASPPPSNIVQNQFGEFFASYDSNSDTVSEYIDANNPAYSTYTYYLTAADRAALNGGYAYNYGPQSSYIEYYVNICPAVYCS